MNTEKLTLTIKEAAATLGISLPTAYALAHSKDFPILKVGRKLLVSRNGLETWLKQQTGE